MTPFATKKTRFLPFLTWLPLVTKQTLRKDIFAGVVGALVVLPQGIAFATIAGLPPQYGLFSAIVPAIIAALWGSSRHLVSGPTTAISLIVYASLIPLASAGSEQFVALAITLSFLVGGMQLLLGVFHLGSLVRLISPSVVVGFTAGAGILIALSQCKHALGIAIPSGSDALHTFVYLVTHLDETNPYLLALTLITVITGVVTRRYVPRVPYLIPTILVGSVAGAVITSLFGPEGVHIPVVGVFDGTLPPFSLPLFDLETLRALAPATLAITLLGLTEAVAIARSIGIRSKQHIDGDQEFIGQGMSNLIGSFFSAYPSSGSFNRTGVNFESGAQTPLAAVFASILLLLMVLVVAPLVAHLPLAVMAGTLFLVAWGIIDYTHIRHIIVSDRSEAVVLGITFTATLLLDLEFAIMLGVLLSLTLFIRHVMRVEVREVAESDTLHSLRNVALCKDTHPYPNTLIVRIDMSIVYMNADTVREAVMHIYTHHRTTHAESPRLLVLNMSGVNYIDSAGLDALHEIQETVHVQGTAYAFINAKHAVRSALARYEGLEHVTIFPNLDALRSHAHGMQV